MKTVQMTIDAKLVAEVDRLARRLGVTRSAFTRRALQAEISRLGVAELERLDREGYRRKPVRRGEFDRWLADQVWPD